MNFIFRMQNIIYNLIPIFIDFYNIIYDVYNEFVNEECQGFFHLTWDKITSFISTSNVFILNFFKKCSPSLIYKIDSKLNYNFKGWYNNKIDFLCAKKNSLFDFTNNSSHFQIWLIICSILYTKFPYQPF